ncbi:hypothetical protein AB0L99_45015 [Streptomyces sp. NPDC051954]|uniref:hypothetical protein n=1 Tax=unclassified Streptomyces TaxID=2593676 RepID=UPI00342F15D2
MHTAGLSPAHAPAAAVLSVDLLGTALVLEWIRQAEQNAPKPMKAFAGFLRQYLDAVTAGLALPWSSGVVEGHVNGVKHSSEVCTAEPRSNSSGPASSPSRDHQ